jgi:hypothetical protein
MYTAFKITLITNTKVKEEPYDLAVISDNMDIVIHGIGKGCVTKHG